MTKRWLIFGIACSLFFLSQFYRVSNAVIAPELLNDLSVDTKGLGLISASFFYAFALTQIPISLLLDKIGPRSVAAIGGILVGIGFIVASMTTTLIGFIIGFIYLFHSCFI